MKTITSVREMQQTANLLRQEGKRIALVPTMGYLHEGHLSLIRRAREKADVVVTSIYVNPTQFGPKEDFTAYPRDLARDSQLAEGAGNDILFAPSDRDMYPDGYQTSVKVEKLTVGLCGVSRPTHFQGVTTIVAKLFNIVKPHIAIFGAKDAQQAMVIKRMTADLNLDIEIDVAPIVRESDGLAMSSRNAYLFPQERKEATIVYRSLLEAERRIKEGERDVPTLKRAMQEMIEAMPSSRIDYVEFVDADNLQPLERIAGDVLIVLAVYIGKTRLIDNLRWPE